MEGSLVDWDAVYAANDNNQLLELLLTQPRARWTERDRHGRTLLHFAAMFADEAAIVALIQSGQDVNARNRWHYTPAHYAAENEPPRALEVLCAAGADLRARTHIDASPLDTALGTARYDDQCARVLVANGARLSTANERQRRYITPELMAFERGVLRCRAAVVAMLSVKRKANLYWWDKFLLREIAYALWATRHNEQWQV